MRTSLLAFAAALSLLAAAPIAAAQSHDHGAHAQAADVTTTPGDGTMGAPPASFGATFPHAMRLTGLVITAQGGDPAAIDIPAAAPATTVSVALPPLSAGNYTFVWTATGADGHAMTGRVRYMVH